MEQISDEQLRREYHELFDEDEPYLRVPDSIGPPTTFDEFHLISCLTMQAFEHGTDAVGLLLMKDQERKERPEVVRWIACYLAGLKAVVKVLAEPYLLGYFERFDVVSTECPSVHVQLFERVKKLYRAMQGVFVHIHSMGPLALSKLPPSEFYRKLSEYRAIDRLDQVDQNVGNLHLQVKAELSRLEFHLQQFPIDPESPKTSKPAEGPTAARNALWLTWRDVDGLSSQEIATRWNNNNPFDLVTAGTVRQGLVRARALIRAKAQEKKRDIL